MAKLWLYDWEKELYKYTQRNVKIIPPRDLGQDLFIGFTQLNQSRLNCLGAKVQRDNNQKA